MSEEETLEKTAISIRNHFEELQNACDELTMPSLEAPESIRDSEPFELINQILEITDKYISGKFEYSSGTVDLVRLVAYGMRLGIHAGIYRPGANQNESVRRTIKSMYGTEIRKTNALQRLKDSSLPRLSDKDVENLSQSFMKEISEEMRKIDALGQVLYNTHFGLSKFVEILNSTLKRDHDLNKTYTPRSEDIDTTTKNSFSICEPQGLSLEPSEDFEIEL